MESWYIDPDIRKAHTLPASFYTEAEMYALSAERIFARTWHYVADTEVLQRPGDVYPFILLEEILAEPLVLTKDENGQARCLSNVCTHRAKVVVEAPGNVSQLRCRYHGRCFRLDGSFKSMPAFEEAQDFPTHRDDLSAVPLQQWLCMWFTSLAPVTSFAEMLAPIRARVHFLPLHTLTFVAEASRTFEIEAHWALYCENYLEGLHIPFVHPALNKALEFPLYEYHLFDYCSLQLGVAAEGQPRFDLPADHPDQGKSVYAWYFFAFPNLMFNFYPWGLSLNVVEPRGIDRCRVHFRTYRFAGVPFNREEFALEQTEMEDEAVVESVQTGIRSRYYDRGRYSPSMEQAVHHFHRLIAEFMQR